MKKQKVVGVLGGIGPDATVEFMGRVIAATPAQDDADHVHMMVDNNPNVPSRIKALIEEDGENPGPFIANMARGLEAAGADFLVMPCNTAHYYYQYIVDAVNIPTLNIIDITIAHLCSLTQQPKRIGFLGSTAISKTALLDSPYAAAGLTPMFPAASDSEKMMGIIRAVKAGQLKPEHIQNYNQIAENLSKLGAEVLVLGCTELSVIASDLNSDLPIIDSLQLLAERVVTDAKAK